MYAYKYEILQENYTKAATLVLKQKADYADMRSEVTYLRDWQAWARRRLKSLEAFERGVHEALNSGDGSYRP